MVFIKKYGNVKKFELYCHGQIKVKSIDQTNSLSL